MVDSRLPILLSEAQQLSMGSDLAIQYFPSFGCIRYFLWHSGFEWVQVIGDLRKMHFGFFQWVAIGSCMPRGNKLVRLNKWCNMSVARISFSQFVWSGGWARFGLVGFYMLHHNHQKDLLGVSREDRDLRGGGICRSPNSFCCIGGWLLFARYAGSLWMLRMFQKRCCSIGIFLSSLAHLSGSVQLAALRLTRAKWTSASRWWRCKIA